jgi:hypothetical protein
MKPILSLPRVALMALTLGTAGVTATFAQTTTTPDTAPSSTPSTTPPNESRHHHHHDSVLSETEKAQLKAAKEKALASNTTLQSQEAALKQQKDTLKAANPPATKDQWEAFHQQKEQFHQSLRAAELQADPTLSPIFAKLDAAHQGHHHST